MRHRILTAGLVILAFGLFHLGCGGSNSTEPAAPNYSGSYSFVATANTGLTISGTISITHNTDTNLVTASYTLSGNSVGIASSAGNVNGVAASITFNVGGGVIETWNINFSGTGFSGSIVGAGAQGYAFTVTASS